MGVTGIKYSLRPSSGRAQRPRSHSKTKPEIKSSVFAGVAHDQQNTDYKKMIPLSHAWHHHCFLRFFVRTVESGSSSGEPMKKQWWCVSCSEQIALDAHGRCSICESDAVAWIGSQTVAWREIVPQASNRVIVPTSIAERMRFLSTK